MTPTADRVLFLVGTTASGKDAVAHALALVLQGEVVSLDSMKVFRGLDVGTSKPPATHRRTVRYHLIDILEPGESFDVATYARMVVPLVTELLAIRRWPIVCGGTFLYLKVLLRGLVEDAGQDLVLRERLREESERGGLHLLHERLRHIDPQRAAQIHPNDTKRVIRALEVHALTGIPMSAYVARQKHFALRLPYTLVGIRRDPSDLDQRIRTRTSAMISEGLVEEVASLLAGDRGLFGSQARSAVGYREILEALGQKENLDRDLLLERIVTNTRRLVRSQVNWSRKFAEIRWLKVEREEAPEQTAERILILLKESDPEAPKRANDDQ